MYKLLNIAQGITVMNTNSIKATVITAIAMIPIINQKAILDGDISTDISLANFAIQIWARRTANAGDLYIDCWAPLPVDEGFVKLSSAFGAIGNTYFGESPTNITDATLIGHPMEVHYDHFRLPVGDGRIYYISTSSASTDTLAENTLLNAADAGKYYERWLSLRGTE